MRVSTHAWAVLAVALAPLVAQPQDQNAMRLEVDQKIEPQGGNPFGEQLNPYTGELTFRQEDVILEGHGPTIKLIRYSRSIKDAFSRPPIPVTAFGNWSLSIPVIHVVTDDSGWFVGDTSDPNRWKRCTHFNTPKYLGSYGTWYPQAGYEGTNLETDDGHSHRFLRRAAGNTAMPSMQDANGVAIPFPLMTRENWQIGCLPQTSNGEPGEAFLVVSPEGNRYYMDRLHYSEPWEVVVPDPDPSNPRPLRQWYALATMFTTKIEDRFGNRVDFHYTDDKLTSITATDGRKVNLVWSGSRVTSIVVNQGTTAERTWTYAYPSGYLSSVRLPDNSEWTLSANAGWNTSTFVPTEDYTRCGIRTRSSTPTLVSTTVTTPSGLVGTFVRTNMWHGRSYVPSVCYTPPGIPPPGYEPYEQDPPFFNNHSLVKKTMHGPGVASQSWNYAYQPATGSTTEDSCAQTSTCASTKWVDVVGPDGNKKRFIYTNRYGQTEGELQRTLTYQGTKLMSDETLAYANPGEGEFPCQVNSDTNTNCPSWTTGSPAVVWRPIKRRITKQDGRTFKWEVPLDCNGKLCFDRFARPTKVVKSSMPTQ